MFTPASTEADAVSLNSDLAGCSRYRQMKLPKIPGFSYFDKIVKIIQANASLNFLEMGMCGDAGVYVITADTNSVNYQQKHF